MSDISEHVRNKQLYNECSEFVSTVFKTFKEDLRGIIQRVRSRPSSIESKYGIDFSLIEYKIRNLNIYKKCKKTMESDPIIKGQINQIVGIFTRIGTMTEWDYLRFLLYKQLSDEKDDLKFNIYFFNSHYLELENFLYNDIIEIRAIIRLHNLHSEIDILELDEGINLRKLDKNDYWSFPPDARHLYGSLTSFILEYIFDSEKIIVPLESTSEIVKIFKERERRNEGIEARLKLRKAISALRLFKCGNVIEGNFTITPKSKILGFSTSTPGNFNPDIIYLDCYEILADEIKDFENFANEFIRTDLTRHKGFNVALRRYNLAYERYRYDDKLIDLFISLESLMFKRTEFGEMTHKLSSRLAKFLKDDFKERKTLRTDITDLYRKRNAVVHGAETEIDKDMCDSLEKYLRQALILYYKKLPASHDDFIDMLDLS